MSVRRLVVVATLVVTVLAVPAAHAARGKFDGHAAFRDLERLVAFGPRPSGSAALERARRYIVGELRRAKIETRLDRFTGTTPQGPVPMANVIAVLPGRRPDVIMIAGHYDTKWFRDIRFVGANDGGSSAALVLELARTLAAAPHEFTYWLAFFDGEEARVKWTATDSLYGSRHLATELERTKRLPRAMVLVDMIGDRNLDIRREGTSTPWLTDLVWAAADRIGQGGHFLPDSLTVEDDHTPFLAAGVPATLLIDFDYPPWHTAADTLDKVSAASLQTVGDVVETALPSIETWLARSSGLR